MAEYCLPYEPTVIAQTDRISREEWLALRRTGIGGSDVAAILGVSPFGTARDLYYDKLNITPAFADEMNKYQKKIGHLLEDVVAEMFAEVTGYPIFQIKKMYRSPEHPFMIADVDYFVALPDGSFAILECKTTSHDSKGKWWHGSQPIIPLNYQYQGRHYMSVMKIDKVFFACLYGNSEDYLIIRELERDLDQEAEMIFCEEEFWTNNVMAKLPPPYTEDGELIIQSVNRHFGLADLNAPSIELDDKMTLLIRQLLALSKEKDCINEAVKIIEDEIKRLKGLIIAEMGISCTATCTLNGIPYIVTYNPAQRTGISKEDLARLKCSHPQIYEQYVTISESRRFNIKEYKEDKKANIA